MQLFKIGWMLFLIVMPKLCSEGLNNLNIPSAVFTGFFFKHLTKGNYIFTNLIVLLTSKSREENNGRENHLRSASFTCAIPIHSTKHSYRFLYHLRSSVTIMFEGIFCAF